MLRELNIATLAVVLMASPVLGQSNSVDDDRIELDSALVDSELRGIWAAYCNALKAGDAEAAVEFHVPESHATQLKSHELLGDHIKAWPNNWSDLTLIEIANPFATYAVTDNSTGLLHTITFVRYPDGKWLIHGM